MFVGLSSLGFPNNLCVFWEIAVTSAPVSSLNLTSLLLNCNVDIHDEICFVISASKYAESTAF